MWKVIIGIIGIYLLSAVFLYWKQKSFIYFPTREAAMTDTKNITLKNDPGILKIWVLNEGKEKAILYFGGNAEPVEYNIDEYQEWFADSTVYLVNYRGYGGSSGSPSESGFYQDALLVYDEVQPDHTSISVIGRSLGSGVATYLASQRKIEKMLLITPFDSVEAVAKKRFPIYPVSWLLTEKFYSIQRAPSITATTLIVIAEDDQIVPKEHAYTLSEAFNEETVQVELIREIGHNSIVQHPQYEILIREFF